MSSGIFGSVLTPIILVTNCLPQHLKVVVLVDIQRRNKSKQFKVVQYLKCNVVLTLLLQLQKYALSSVSVGDAAVDVHSRATIVKPLTFLPQLDHACRHVTVCVSVEAVPAVCFIDGDVQVRQVELDGGFRVSRGHADALDSLSHHCAL